MTEPTPLAYLLRETRRGRTAIRPGIVFKGIEAANKAAGRLSNKWASVEVVPVYDGTPTAAGDMYAGLYAERCADVEYLRAVLMECRSRFAEYALSHYAKKTADGNLKAVRNDTMAAMIDAVLKDRA